MTDAIIHTNGDYTLNLNGGTTVVAARNYHLARTTDHDDTNASLTLLPGNWVAAATQSDPSQRPGDTLCALVRHVINIRGPLRVADDDNSPGILEGLVLAATDGGVSYAPPEARDRDIAHHRIR